MHRDSPFWSVVGALALGTALLTAYGTTSRAADRERPASAATTAPVTPRARPSAPGAPSARATPSRAHDRRAGGARTPDATAEPRRPVAAAEAREALAAFVQLARERRAAASRAGAAAPLDPKTEMPSMEMSFEQYRLWAKLGDRLAERDYRAIEELQPELGAEFEPELVAASLDALAADYAAYLADVVERNCSGLEPESVWRKVGFMALWLTRLERRSEELDGREREALRACGY